jgi:hypothetical protein
VALAMELEDEDWARARADLAVTGDRFGGVGLALFCESHAAADGLRQASGGARIAEAT